MFISMTIKEAVEILTLLLAANPYPDSPGVGKALRLAIEALVFIQEQPSLLPWPHKKLEGV